jgi:hypothetical protein
MCKAGNLQIPDKRVAIVQSNYIPWKGYFDLIATVDEFILFDDMQYTRRDWRNRNQIKTPHGPHWLTVPVKVKGRFEQTIRETEIQDTRWAQDHWKALQLNYARASHFKQLAGRFESLYLEPCTHLSDLNGRFIKTICSYLGINTRITPASDYDVSGDKTERLVQLCLKAGASVYVSGPAARSYLDESAFHPHGMTVQWFDYSGYPEYPQLWGTFLHRVTVLDLLFNTGPEAPAFMKHVTPGT